MKKITWKLCWSSDQANLRGMEFRPLRKQNEENIPLLVAPFWREKQMEGGYFVILTGIKLQALVTTRLLLLLLGSGGGGESTSGPQGEMPWSEGREDEVVPPGSIRRGPAAEVGVMKKKESKSICSGGRSENCGRPASIFNYYGSYYGYKGNF